MDDKGIAKADKAAHRVSKREMKCDFMAVGGIWNEEKRPLKAGHRQRLQGTRDHMASTLYMEIIL
ncbi:hypothetical protein GCM10023213_41200 [Prosthecobacter algae]|uniref:Uncharacterized protein n=1 Tax=Prosthecobacter algae TaxID=1144682 RepID=A0ABP9PK83_9BACT